MQGPRTTLVLLASLWLASAAANASQARDADATWRVDGLEAAAEIRVDRWGVPHIYAGTHYDAFFVQGFNAARDRLWQIDLWRRRGLGRLAEVFGEAFVPRDRAARLFLYRGGMFREWLAYGSDAKRIAEAFTAGINAYVALTERHPELLPVEFELLDYRPSRWRPEDVVRIRSHGLWRNVASEVTRARVACAHGLEADRIRQPLEPEWSPTVPEGLDPCSLPEGVLEVYRRATAPVRFSRDGEPLAGLAPRATQRALVQAAGSNNWAVAPERSATGRPILANDPHRSHAVPSLRYIAHLNAPGLNVIGAGEPALPGISIGHNRRIAFGLTIFAMDQEDLYVYRTHPDDPDRYRYQDRWVPMDIRVETIRVRDGEERRAALAYTRHGPVVYRDEEANRAYAVRAAWLEPGMAPYFGSVEYMRAENWREFVGALNRWGAPAENQAYADVDGNIGYKPAGLLPRRGAWDGLLPVPGDGRYEWRDFHSMDAMPVEHNPERGWVATANQNTLPGDYPIDRVRVGFEWTPPWRYRRIAEVLEDSPQHSLADSLALQRDYVSLPARELLAALPEIAPEGTADRAAMALLADFDGVLAADSAAAALFEVWFTRHLRPGVTRALLGEEALETVGAADTRVAVEAVTEPGAWLDADGRDTLVRRTLAAAWRETRERLGGDPARWRWGDLHRIAFTHPLEPYADEETREAMSLPELPMGGSGYTANNTAYAPEDFEVRAGASWRMVLDVGNWDAARMTNAPGQSGRPGSPFYGDLLEGWAEGESFPLLYSHDAVAEATVKRIRLLPAEGTNAGR